MSFRINTNVPAYNALRNLSLSSAEFNKSLTRLQTGLRINDASDDPSGLIASESMRAQISSMDQAVKNSQAALNYAKTAEGGLQEMNKLLNDARTLAVANGNGTLDTAQKNANQTQLNNILASITRIAGTTQYNNKNLLDGSAGVTASVTRTDLVSSASFGSTFNGSATQAGSITVNVTTAATRASSAAAGAATSAAAGDAIGVAGTYVVNGKSFSYLATDTFQSVVDKVNLASSETGVTATWSTDHVQLTNIAYGSKAMSITDTGGALKATAGSLGVTAGVDAVASVTVNGQGPSTFTGTGSATGNGLRLRDGAGNEVTLAAAANSVTNHGAIGSLAIGSSQFQIGANAGQTANLALGKFDAVALGFAGGTLDITGSDMSAALAAIDTAIGTVTGARSSLGSFMKNTLESNVRSLGVARENLSASESQIRDADMAQEMTNFTRLQILQQSGMAMLAQANQAPQAVMSLLQG